MRTAQRSLWGVLLVALAWTSPVSAAGYDTPILYTARHMGMGGTAIASVRDGSAAFHNPAGLGHVNTANVLIDISLLTGHLVASPGPFAQDIYARQAKSNATIAPFFLVGGGIRVFDWLVAGLAFYPVASAGGSYEYAVVEPLWKPQGGGSSSPQLEQTWDVYDETKIVFFELAPTLAVNLPGNLRLGFAYRLSMIQMDRYQGTPSKPKQVLEFELSGFNFAGYKVGLQWAPIKELELGLVYRSETETVIEGDESRLTKVLQFDSADTTFTLPDKVGMGVRGTLAPVSLALDVEYTFNSKVQTQTFNFYKDSKPDDPSLAVTNYARWSDNATVRLGAEYCFTLEPLGLDHAIKPRIGYVYDGQVGNKAFPTAFGTPPTATQTWTAGVGYDGGPWEVNLAYAYRYGKVTVDATEMPYAGLPNADECQFCGNPGLYEIALHGIYTDFSWDF